MVNQLGKRRSVGSNQLLSLSFSLSFVASFILLTGDKLHTSILSFSPNCMWRTQPQCMPFYVNWFQALIQKIVAILWRFIVFLFFFVGVLWTDELIFIDKLIFNIRIAPINNYLKFIVLRKGLLLLKELTAANLFWFHYFCLTMEGMVIMQIYEL